MVNIVLEGRPRPFLSQSLEPSVLKHLFTPSSSQLRLPSPPSRPRPCLPVSRLQDYGNNGGLGTARASEETAPTHESPPPAGPSNHQTPAVSNRTPPTRSSRPFYPSRCGHNHPFIHSFHNEPTCKAVSPLAWSSSVNIHIQSISLKSSPRLVPECSIIYHTSYIMGGLKSFQRLLVKGDHFRSRE